MRCLRIKNLGMRDLRIKDLRIEDLTVRMVGLCHFSALCKQMEQVNKKVVGEHFPGTIQGAEFK